MHKRVRYGIIGFGGIAENRTAREGFALDRERFPRGAPGPYTLVGATDIDPGREKTARAYGLQWYASADAMLSDPGIDAIYIATPNSRHAEIAAEAIAGGRHVLLEKPMTTSVADAEQLCRMAVAKGVSLSVNLMMKKNSLNRQARSLLRQGIIGTVEHIVTHMEFLYGSTPEEAAAWRCSRPEERGGPIGDVASHCMYMGEFLYDDRITSLRCTYTPRTLEIAVENGAVISYRTAGGYTGTCRVAFNQPRGNLAATIAGQGFDAYGTGGTLSGLGTLFQLSGHPDEPYAIHLLLDSGSETKKIDADPDKQENIYQAQIAEHAESILSGTPMDGTDGLHNLSLVEACYRSAEENGREIAVD